MKQVVAYLPTMIQRVSIAAGWLAFAFIVYATLSPIDSRPVVAGPQLEHFAAFGLMGLAFGLAYPNRFLLVIAIVAGSAFGLEALQLLTPDRHARVLDAVMKAAGGICGISASQLMLLLLRTSLSRIR
ncbi:VanZ family protein [Bradyrhizobium sp.]|uniref:VanZ family protein n=1 Tax=Bradyrhizobium sp. TaxID=376 RepID=UPI003D0C8B91